jgi:hypothetical protein
VGVELFRGVVIIAVGVEVVVVVGIDLLFSDDDVPLD